MHGAPLQPVCVHAVPAGDLVMVDAVQEARPRWLPEFIAPWVVWNYIVLRLGDAPDGRWQLVHAASPCSHLWGPVPPIIRRHAAAAVVL